MYPIYRRTVREPRLVQRGSTAIEPRRIGLWDQATTDAIWKDAQFSMENQRKLLADISPSMDRASWVITLFDDSVKTF